MALAALVMALLSQSIAAEPQVAWSPKPAPLMTKWASQVDPRMPLPEYPRPQLARSRWLNLNGLWEFAVAAEGDVVPTGKSLPERILVPFAVESSLSGLMRHEERMWYRRTFSLPPDWQGQRVLLHFGAVDWQTTVYINGKEVGGHKGGYCAFSFDITDQLKADVNEVIVNVYDGTDASDRYQATGKQTLRPEGYWYTASSGIWQTVWLEPVPSDHISKLDLTPDVSRNTLRIGAHGPNLVGRTIEAVASAAGKPVAHSSGAAGQDLELAIPNAHLWSSDDPFLYDLTVVLKQGDRVIDTVTSYFGMRSLTKGKVAGIMRPLVNGKFVFQVGTLDQGWWPDGLYTAPTEEALKFDIEQTKKCGFNTIRKHIKVEPARWYYWCDKLGVMVWQDMPSIRNEGILPTGEKSEKRPEAGAEWKRQFEAEFQEEIDQFRSSPSIIGWILFNEGWGEYRDAKEVMALGERLKAYDPSRFLAVDTAAGPARNGDVIDWHVYPGPGSPPPLENRFAGAGEWGGLGFVVKDHSWKPADRDQDTPEKFTAKYVGMVGRLKSLMYSPGLSYAFFTQITDVEGERNGLFTYDRAVFKGEREKFKTAHDDLVAASQELGQGYTGNLGADFANTKLWSPRSGTWKTDAGSYKASAPGLAMSLSHFHNFIADLDVTVPATGEAGLVFRSQGAGEQITGYWASVAAHTLTLSYAEKGKWLPIKSVPINLTSDATCHLRIVAFGGTLRCFVNDLNKVLLEVTEDRQLVGAIGLRSQAADARFAGLVVTNPFVRLRPVNDVGFIVHNSKDNLRRDITQLDRNVNRDDDAIWRLAPGLAESQGISLESARLPGWYLRDQDGLIVFAQDDGTPEFKRDATWLRRAGLTADKGHLHKSYESFAHPGEFLRLGRPLERKAVKSEGQKIDATFEEMR